MKNCKTCAYAIITIVAECTKRNEKGEYIHEGGMSPPGMTCSHWEQADEYTLMENSIDWSKAEIVIVD